MWSLLWSPQDSTASFAELSLACPGSNDQERASFLAGGLRLLLTDLHPAALPEPQQKFAFSYGVALHDIERVQL